MERGEKKLNPYSGMERGANDLASRENQLITIYDETFRFLVGGSNILVDNKITLIGGSNDKIILVGGQLIK